jgi:hypothetical protein
MQSVDQKSHDLLRFLAEHSDLFAVQGSVQESYRWYQGRQLGPFFRLSFRQAGKQRSRYLGRDPALAAQIESRLQELQAPLVTARQIERSLAEHRRQLKLAKVEFRRHVEAHQLRLQGNEVRGWRTRANVALAPLSGAAREGAGMAAERTASAEPPQSGC